MYADDTQIYTSFIPGINEAEAEVKLEACLAEVRDWMACNYLKLNDSKTEFLVIGTKQNLTKVESTSIKIGDSVIEPSKSAKNIGAVFDQCMKMDKHVNTVCKSGWYNLFRISKLKKFLTVEQLKTAIHAFVTSRLDQNNSLLVGLPMCAIIKLKRVQHAAARLLLGAKKGDHASPLLKKLHWLPIEQRITFKILLLVYKSVNAQGPQYLRELLVPYTPGRSLRSSSASLLHQPKSRSGYGDRSFSVAAPKLWNTLPNKIRESPSVNTFKSALKTYLFKHTYGSD